MELGRDQLDPAKNLLQSDGEHAPVEVFAAMLSMAAPKDVVATVTTRSEKDAGTEWRTVWLTETRLISCNAVAQRRGWDFGSHVHVNVDASIDAWSCRIDDVVSLSVTESSVWKDFGRTYAAVGSVIAMRGGKTLAMPLFGGIPDAREIDDVEAFVEALANRL